MHGGASEDEEMKGKLKTLDLHEGQCHLAPTQPKEPPMLWLLAAGAVSVAFAFMRLGALLVWMKVLTVTVQAMAVALIVLLGVVFGRHIYLRKKRYLSN